MKVFSFDLLFDYIATLNDLRIHTVQLFLKLNFLNKHVENYKRNPIMF
jgi:hypothetical protein